MDSDVNTPHTNFLDELKVITIHKDDIKTLIPPVVKAFILEHLDFEHYPDGLKNGEVYDKVEEFKLVLKNLEDIKNSTYDNESNIEGLLVDRLSELFRKMTLQDIRNLHLERLISTTHPLKRVGL